MNFSRNRGFVSQAEQQTLALAHVAIAGVGGDGGQVAETLARLGVQRFSFADPEVFEPENLNRQNSCTTATLGRNKAEVLRETVLSINPNASVDVFPDGINEDNVAAFVVKATLVIDETEFTRPELAVMLARASRSRGLPVLTGLNVGFGCLVTSFRPDGLLLERHLGLDPASDLADIALQKVPLGRWVPRLPSYGDEQVLKAVSDGRIDAPSVAPGVALAASAVSTEAFNHLTGRKQPVWAPRSIWFDPMERKCRVIRYPALSFWTSTARLVVNSRLGRNTAMTIEDSADQAAPAAGAPVS